MAQIGVACGDRVKTPRGSSLTAGGMSLRPEEYVQPSPCQHPLPFLSLEAQSFPSDRSPPIPSTFSVHPDPEFSSWVGRGGNSLVGDGPWTAGFFSCSFLHKKQGLAGTQIQFRLDLEVIFVWWW